MTKKFIIETALPDNAIKLCENAKDKQLKVYYKDGYQNFVEYHICRNV